MIYLFLLSAAVAGAWVLRHYMTPSCPRCRHRNWNRKLCAPLLFCRTCATRIDQHGRTYN
ncbi:hypothetical protein [Longimicrobium sp.]|uniref:hypothetical protein n=1 Tax=Longimicrobium sp. TaxID=2029185 RepID=UPI003B3B186A